MDPTASNPNAMAARPAEASTSTAAQPAKGKPRPTQRSEMDPEAVLEQIRLQLGEISYREAQRLAKEAAARFPDHDGIRLMNRALNEPTVQTSAGRGYGRAEEFSWLSAPPDSARGQWVALVGDEMVAAAKTLAELADSLRSKKMSKAPLVVRIA